MFNEAGVNIGSKQALDMLLSVGENFFEIWEEGRSGVFDVCRYTFRSRRREGELPGSVERGVGRVDGGESLRYGIEETDVGVDLSTLARSLKLDRPTARGWKMSEQLPFAGIPYSLHKPCSDRISEIDAPCLGYAARYERPRY